MSAEKIKNEIREKFIASLTSATEDGRVEWNYRDEDSRNPVYRTEVGGYELTFGHPLIDSDRFVLLMKNEIDEYSLVGEEVGPLADLYGLIGRHAMPRREEIMTRLISSLEEPS